MTTRLLGRLFGRSRKGEVEILSRGDDQPTTPEQRSRPDRSPRTKQSPQSKRTAQSRQAKRAPRETGRSQDSPVGKQADSEAVESRQLQITPLFVGPVRMYVRHWEGRAHVAITRGDTLVEHHVCNRSEAELRVGDIYAGRVASVKDTYAFVDLGDGRRGFISRDDIPEIDPAKPLHEQMKVGDSLLCQVAGLPAAGSGKGPRLTGRIVLKGRFLAVVSGNANGGKIIVERNVTEPDLRHKCYRILETLGTEEYSLVGLASLAGAGEGDGAAIHSEKQSLTRRLDTFHAEAAAHADSDEGPRLIDREADPLLRVIRDRAGADIDRIVVDRPGVAEYVRSYVRGLGIDEDIVTTWEDDDDIYDGNGVTHQLAKAMQREVPIGGGAYLVIDRAEAGVFIDVNTGRGGGRSQHEVNMAAAEEIGRQLRVRNIGGMIVVDFAGGAQRSQNEDDTRLDELTHHLRRALAGDDGLPTVVPVDGLHVAVITRKRTDLSLVEEHSETCEHCHGRGVHVDTYPVLGGTAADPRKQSRGGQRSRDGAGRDNRSANNATSRNLTGGRRQNQRGGQTSSRGKRQGHQRERKSRRAA